MSAATAAASPEAYSAAVPAKATVPSATMSPAAMSSAAMSSSAMSAATMSSAAMSAATTAAGVCFECEKRHDEEQHRGHASAGRQHQLHAGAELGAPHRRGRLRLAISPRMKSF